MAQTMSFPESVRLPNYVQNPRIVPLGEWLPDQPSFNNPGMTIARNVVPLSSASYGPLAAFVASTNVLPAPVFGAFTFFDQVRAEHIFAGTGAALYHMKTGDAGFANISNTGEVYNAYITNPWCMTAYQQSIIATNGIDPPQIFTVGTSETFGFLTSDLSAPIGRYVAAIRDFIVFGNVVEGETTYPQRVHWSAIGDPTNWPDPDNPNTANAAAEVQSGYVNLRSDLGWIRGIASGLQNADGAVFMDNAIYSLWYIGSPAVFDFQLAQGAVGCRISNSIVVNHGVAFFLGQDGFWSFDGVNPNPIGSQKINRWFFTDPNDGVDPAYIELTQGAADPSGQLIYWLYCGPNSGGTPNRMLIYHWQLGHWSMGEISAQWVAKGMTTGFSLDELDEFGNMSDLPNYTLDSPYWQGGAPVLIMFNSDNQMGTLSGPNLAATIETLEAQPAPGMRSRITSARPLIDGTNAVGGSSSNYGQGLYGAGLYSYTPQPLTVALGSRNRLEDTVSYATAVTMNAYGECPQRLDARYFRGQIDIPAEAIWYHAMGVEINFTKTTPR